MEFSGNLPFVWKPLDTCNSEYDLPNFLPFKAKIDEETGLLYQQVDEQVEKCLKKAYQVGSVISGLMSDTGNGKLYTEDFLCFIQKNCGNIYGKKILEIGCGTGYLLHRLAELGADVIGIEPGVSHKMEHVKYGVDVADDFFPSAKIEDEFDIVIFYGVLEHIIDTNEFLSSVRKYLKITGNIICAVPNCEEHIKFGDISMFFHEHYSYFTSDTLGSCFDKSHFIVKCCQKAGYGGLIYALAESCPHPKNQKEGYNVLKQEIDGDFYFALAEKKIIKMKTLLEKHNNINIGMYIAGRAINMLSVIKNDVGLLNIRFFDDNPILKDKYYPGFDIKIESRDDFYENPTDVTFIMSRSFENTIYANIKSTATKIYTWSDIFLGD